MAANARPSTPTTRQIAAAERVEGFTAEQRRLKAEAASRRAAAAERAAEGFVVAPESPPASARRNKYLQ